jgi:hypothetical protein
MVHRRLTHDAWNEPAVRAAIEEIAADAIANFHPDAFWPLHPSDEGVGDGAAGVIWALDYLLRIGASRVAQDFRPVLPRLMERTLVDFESNAPAGTRNNGSLLRGDMGADLLALRIAPRSKHWTADPRVYVGHSRINGGRHPHGRDVEGTEMASKRRRPDCWPIWKTRRKVRFGPKISMVSATAFSGPSTVSLGNVIPLLREWNWLTRAQQEQVAEFVPKTLAANAWRSEFGTTWGPRSKREKWLRIISAVTVHPAS